MLLVAATNNAGNNTGLFEGVLLSLMANVRYYVVG